MRRARAHRARRSRATRRRERRRNANAYRDTACWRVLLMLVLPVFVVSMVTSAPPSSATRPGADLWHDKALPPAQRAESLLAAMNITEKLLLLQGAKGPGIGNTAPITRLGIPALRLEDGPNGVADWQTNVVSVPQLTP